MSTNGQGPEEHKPSVFAAILGTIGGIIPGAFVGAIIGGDDPGTFAIIIALIVWILSACGIVMYVDSHGG